MPKRDITDGERLCSFIKRELSPPDIWSSVASRLTALGRGHQLANLFEEIAAVQLTGRLVIGGKSIADQIGGRESLGEIEYCQLLRDFVRETTEIGAKVWKDVGKRLLNRCVEGVRACYENVTKPLDQQVRQQAGRKPRCFLCGEELIIARNEQIAALSDENQKRVYEVEHVWPRSYGGNSILENLLPACHECNNRKGNYASWGMVDVQALILEPNPPPEQLQRISGQRRFALLSRSALELADQENLTLKEAFRQLGSGIAPYVIRSSDATDFFNVASHRRSQL